MTLPCSTSARRIGRRAGFTLVELLVVIGIIAVLVGILLPTISRARESAKTVGCLANMKQIVTACMAYSTANSEFIIPAEWYFSPPPGSPPISPLAPTPLNCNESWCNILVNGGYVSAPNSLGRGPQTKSIFYCPSGNPDVGNFNPSVFKVANGPPDRVSGFGDQAIRYYSVSHATTVDCWYGINGGASDFKDMTQGPPCRRVAEPGFVFNQGTLDLIRRSSQMVMFYDGLFFHLHFNPNRINARHARQTRTNLAFFDGHAESYETASLPGGLNAPSNTFTSAATIVANSPRPPNPTPLWVLEQQY